MDIGFIGLGRMGQAIAANLARAGHRLSLWNRSPAAAQALVAGGARLVAAPADTAGGEVLMSMLADDEAHRRVLIEGGVFTAAARGLIYVNLATVSVALARELAALAAARGVIYLAAPVFGRPEAAQAADSTSSWAETPRRSRASSHCCWRSGSASGRWARCRSTPTS